MEKLPPQVLCIYCRPFTPAFSTELFRFAQLFAAASSNWRLNFEFAIM
jgi:hypothetical protein